MNRNIGWIILALILVFILVAVIAVPLMLVNSFNQTASRALAPLENANQVLQTQVSEILNPTPTIIPDPITIINEIRPLARLETIQYTVEKVITAEIGQNEFDFLFGDRLLFVAHGEVLAGVDLGKITPDDVTLSEDDLNLCLPQAEVFIAALDNDQSYVYDRETGILRRQQIDLETQARQVAEQEIHNAAVEDGILERAQVNAETFLDSLFTNLGYDDITFECAPE